MHTDLTLRPARVEDLTAVAGLYLRARAAAVPQLPPVAHAPDAVDAWVRGWDLSSYDVWLALRGDELVGFARSTDTWLDDLYVDPDHQRAGVGRALLDLVKAARPDGFCLWVFATNADARDFYAAHGLIELETTDGTANEEGQPDIRVAWPGPAPMTFLRRLIDDVDLVLGDVLARRAALTRAVQAVKPSGERDPAREAEIVRRVAAVAPELGQERVGRIMDAVITESLDAAR